MKEERLQKIIANAGLASRREAEAWIRAGRVSINGTIAQLGEKARATDTIRIDGRILRMTEKLNPERRMIAYHKPEGEVSTRKDPEGRPTIFDTLPSVKNGRWISVGRLDINTSGLMFFTTDGELANRLMHPSHQIMRRYAVRVRGEVTDEAIEQLLQGVELEDGPAKFEKIDDGGGEGSNHWYQVTLREGKNREVRRLWEAVGVQVSRLQRIQYGPYELPRSLRRGRWLELMPHEVGVFEELVGLKKSAVSKTTHFDNRKRQKSKRMKARKTFRR